MASISGNKIGRGKGIKTMSLDQEKLIYTPIHGWIDGPESRPIKVDKWSRSMITMDNEKHQTFRGYNYVTYGSTLVNTGGKLAFRFDTNYSRPDFRWFVKTSTAGIMRTYLMDATAGWKHDPGSEPVIFNRNVEKIITAAGTSAMSICTSPLTTGVTIPDPTLKVHLGSAAGPGGVNTSGGQNTATFLAYLNTLFMLEIEAATDDCAIYMEFNWSEQIPYDTPPLIVPV
jgi:hypothetical protein